MFAIRIFVLFKTFSISSIRSSTFFAVSSFIVVLHSKTFSGGLCPPLPPARGHGGKLPPRHIAGVNCSDSLQFAPVRNLDRKLARFTISLFACESRFLFSFLPSGFCRCADNRRDTQGEHVAYDFEPEHLKPPNWLPFWLPWLSVGTYRGPVTTWSSYSGYFLF